MKTFLYFTDQNIQETGDQLIKSNNGPDNCCYRYCGSSVDGICLNCDSLKVLDESGDELTQPIVCPGISSTTTSSQNPCIIPFYASSSSSLSSSHTSLMIINLIIFYKLTILWNLFNVVAWTKYIQLQLAGS